MSCAVRFEPPCDRDLTASSSSGANCREDPPEEEEDRLSTAAPSICEEATTRWADTLDGHKRWADLLDSEDEDLKCVPAVQSKTKKRWADLADELEEGTDTTQSPEDLDTKTGDVTSPSCHEESPSWKVKGTQQSRDRWPRDSRASGSTAWTSTWTSTWTSASSSSHAPGGWGNQMQWRPRHERHEREAKASYHEGHRSNWGDSWGGWYERPKGKGKGKSKAKGEGKSAGAASKCQCQFIIGIEEENKFRVCRRLLGPQGQHMKEIAQGTGAKLRLRGRGSKFLEGPEQQESSDPLMLCVSAPDPASYEKAKRQISSLLEDIYAQYRDFQQTEGCKSPTPRLNLHEGPRPGSF